MILYSNLLCNFKKICEKSWLLFEEMPNSYIPNLKDNVNFNYYLLLNKLKLLKSNKLAVFKI